MFGKLIGYIKSTKLEMQKVTWPARESIIYDTVLVALVSLGLAAFLGALDYLFQYLLNLFIL